MSLYDIFVQGLGLMGVAGCMLCFHGKNVKNVLKIKLTADIIWGVHYFLLGAVNGYIANAICLCREIVFINGNKKVFRWKYWVFVFMLLNWISLAFSWKGFFSLLPALASTLATYSFWQRNVTVTRIIGMVNNCIMFTYSLCVDSYSGMLNEVLTFASILCALAVAFFRNKEVKKADS